MTGGWWGVSTNGDWCIDWVGLQLSIFLGPPSHILFFKDPPPHISAGKNALLEKHANVIWYDPEYQPLLLFYEIKKTHIICFENTQRHSPTIHVWCLILAASASLPPSLQ